MDCQQRSRILAVDLGVDLSGMLPEINQCKHRFQKDLWSTILKGVLKEDKDGENKEDGEATEEENKDEENKDEENKESAVPKEEGEATPNEEEDTENKNNLSWLGHNSVSRSRNRMAFGWYGAGVARNLQQQQQQQQHHSFQHPPRRGTSFDTACWGGSSFSSRYLPLPPENRRRRIQLRSPPPPLQQQRQLQQHQQHQQRQQQRWPPNGSSASSNRNRNNWWQNGSGDEHSEKHHFCRTQQRPQQPPPPCHLMSGNPSVAPQSKRFPSISELSANCHIRSYSTAPRREILDNHYSDDFDYESRDFSAFITPTIFPNWRSVQAGYFCTGSLFGNTCEESDSESAGPLMANIGHYVTSYDAATNSSNMSGKFCPLTVDAGWDVPRRHPPLWK